MDSDAEEAEVQRQIAHQKELVQRDARREKKRRAKAAQKARLRRGAGIVEESNVDDATREQVFSFSEANKLGGVDALKEVAPESDDESVVNVRPSKGELGAKNAANYEEYASAPDRLEAIEDQLDSAYEAYADRRAEKTGAPRVEKQKRAKKYRDAVAARIVQDDVELIDGDVEQYASTLNHDSSSDDDDVDAAAEASSKRWFANPLFDEMPRTEKEVRREKRLKAKQRKERRDLRRGDVEEQLDIVPVTTEEPRSEKETEARKLIKAGVGQVSKDEEGFEIVEEDPFSRREQRLKTYISDSEDDDDKAETLALASMMLRRSKAKKLVDASYNRFAWNDPRDLPAWFVDDEKRHDRGVFTSIRVVSGNDGRGWFLC